MTIRRPALCRLSRPFIEQCGSTFLAAIPERQIPIGFLDLSVRIKNFVGVHSILRKLTRVGQQQRALVPSVHSSLRVSQVVRGRFLVACLVGGNFTIVGRVPPGRCSRIAPHLSVSSEAFLLV